MIEESVPEQQMEDTETPEQKADRLDARVAELEHVLNDKKTELEESSRVRQELESRLKTSGDYLMKAVAGYKSLVVRSNPDILPELITGDTIESIDDSLNRAKELVDKVRRDVESGISLARVPAGAPERTSLDLSTLSPHEKIQHALGRK